MQDTQHKRRYFTKAQISRALKQPRYFLNVKEIKESKCEAKCWAEKMRARARRFDVTLEDMEIREQAVRPATYNLRICNIPTKEGNVNVLFVRYYFHINVDVSKISVEEMSALTNNHNLKYGAMKTVLRNVTTDGYGFCAEIRCHVSDLNDLVRCYDKYKWEILDIPLELLKCLSFYYRNKEGWDWKEKSVNPVGLDEFDNFYTLYPEHELSHSSE